MAELFSRYVSGTQLTAGTMTGSVVGVSGINPLADRLNSVATSDNLVTGSMVSGTNTFVHISGITATGHFSGATLDGYVGDHGTAATDMVVNTCYGTSATPPAAATTTEGAIYIQYIA